MKVELLGLREILYRTEKNILKNSRMNYTYSVYEDGKTNDRIFEFKVREIIKDWYGDCEYLPANDTLLKDVYIHTGCNIYKVRKDPNASMSVDFILSSLDEKLNAPSEHQRVSSAGTSVSTIAKVYGCGYDLGKTVLDYGGGKYDKVVEALRGRGIECRVYDPYNRSATHNSEVLRWAKRRVDTVVCANVLNVIEQDSVLNDILDDLFEYSTGHILIQIYEGSKDGVVKVTKKGYQRNLKAVQYEYLIRQYADLHGYEMTRKGNIFELVNKNKLAVKGLMLY